VVLEESKYDEATEKFIEAFGASETSRFQIHNAIKVSGMIDFEFLKKLNKMHQNVENIFNLAVEETKKYYDDRVIISEDGSEDHSINKKLKVNFCILLI
jgi:hypothetical protein